jgi:biopolymer transport protein ExbD
MIDVVFNLIIFFMIVTDLTSKETEILTLPWSNHAVEDKESDLNERRVIINISKAGTPPKFEDWNPATGKVQIHIKRVPYDLNTLTTELFKHAETKRDMDHPMKPSEIFVLIRCDAEIRWREVQWVMQACADPTVRIYKLQFATREETKK